MVSKTEQRPVHVPLAETPLNLLASLKAARSNLLSIIPKIATTQPMVSGRTGVRWHMVMDPGAIKHMLLTELDSYPKSTTTKNLLRPAIGESLFIAEGAHWRWQRRAAAPAFSHRNVMNLSPYMTSAALACCTRVAQSGRTAVNMYDEMVRTTFDVIADVTFTDDGGFDGAAVHASIDAYISAAGKVSLLDMIGAPDWIPRPSRLMTGAALKQMKKVADQSIEERVERGAKSPPDLLDLLLSGEDPETTKKMNIAELRDNLLTFIVAGHETTALALSWAFYLCAFDQDAQDKARAEIKNVTEGEITGDHVTDLPYVRAIIEETMRLYPPAGMIARTALKQDMLCDREIKPGDTIMVPIYALHRNRLLWDDPDSFRPERFLTEQKVDRYAYLPFGDGPRICIGASFAIQEAVIVLANLLQRFRFTAVAGKTPDPVMILTLRPEGGVWLQAQPI